MSKVRLGLGAKRHELDGSTKGQIYIAKIAIGCIAPWAWWVVTVFVPAFPLWAVVTISAIVLAGFKVRYYLKHPDRPIEWDDPLDWICDAALHFAWLGVHQALRGDYWTGAVLFVAWLLTYPYSAE